MDLFESGCIDGFELVWICLTVAALMDLNQYGFFLSMNQYGFEKTVAGCIDGFSVLNGRMGLIILIGLCLKWQNGPYNKPWAVN